MSETMVTYQACDYSDWDETINFTQFITIRTTIFTYLICVNMGAIFSPVKVHEKVHKFTTKYPKLAKILRSLCRKEHRFEKEHHLRWWRGSQILAMHFHICINHQLHRNDHHRIVLMVVSRETKDQVALFDTF